MFLIVQSREKKDSETNPNNSQYEHYAPIPVKYELNLDGLQLRLA